VQASPEPEVNKRQSDDLRFVARDEEADGASRGRLTARKGVEDEFIRS
jgi:hypothetical protein